MRGNVREMRKKDKIFLVTIILFFGITAYLTYYSKVVYLQKLPLVQTVMPQFLKYEESSGMPLYEVPENAILADAGHKRYILTARFERDVLGERYRANPVHVWIVEQKENGMAVVEGIVKSEPVILNTNEEKKG